MIFHLMLTDSIPVGDGKFKNLQLRQLQNSRRGLEVVLGRSYAAHWDSLDIHRYYIKKVAYYMSCDGIFQTHATTTSAASVMSAT